MVLAAVAGCARFQSQPLTAAGTAADFESRSLTNSNLRSFIETHHASGEWPRPSWDPDSLALVALYYHPDLAVARAEWARADAARITAGGRPNPSMSVTPGFDSGIPGNFSPWLVSATLDWPVETAGKRGKRIVEAGHLAEAARWNLVGEMWRVRSRVRSAWVAMYAARETESSLARQAAAQSNVVRLLEGRAAVGSVSSVEVTQSRVALDTTRLAWQDATGQYRQASAQLANALGVPLRALDGVEFAFAGLEQFPWEVTRPEVRARALLNRSDVRGALAEYAASQAALQLEIANQYPDLHLGPGYAWNNGNAGDSQWTLGLTLALPVVNQNQGPIAEAEARRAVAAAHFVAVQANAVGEIDGALAGYDASLRQAATARELSLHLQERLESVRAQARLGEADPLAVAAAQVEFATGEQSRLASLIKTQQAYGQLEDALQSPIEMPEPLPSSPVKNEP